MNGLLVAVFGGQGDMSVEENAELKKESVAASVKPRLSGLLPVGVFLVLFIGSGVVLQDFYSMPAIVAFCARWPLPSFRTRVVLSTISSKA